MLTCLEEQTGLAPEPGCDLAVRMYAVAAQVYALYIQAQWVTRQAFPQTAESDYLDLHAQLRGLRPEAGRPPRRGASGFLWRGRRIRTGLSPPGPFA